MIVVEVSRVGTHFKLDPIEFFDGLDIVVRKKGESRMTPRIFSSSNWKSNIAIY